MSEQEITAEKQTGLSHAKLRVQLRHCPFCGRRPDFLSWHGGEPTKVFVGCTSQYFGECVRPSTTGETWAEAKRYWNKRSRRGLTEDQIAARAGLSRASSSPQQHSDGKRG